MRQVPGWGVSDFVNSKKKGKELNMDMFFKMLDTTTFFNNLKQFSLTECTTMTPNQFKRVLLERGRVRVYFQKLIHKTRQIAAKLDDSIVPDDA